MDAFEALADPVRRRVLEILGPGEALAGGIGQVITSEFGISQPAVSQHLRVLRDAGFVVVRTEGNRRHYRVVREALAETGSWFDRFRDPFAQPLDALATELARGRRATRDLKGARVPRPPGPAPYAAGNSAAGRGPGP